MSAVKKYFKGEFSLQTLSLEHHRPTDFYLSGWQKTRSVVPLLICRVILFLAALGIVVASSSIYVVNGIYGYWFIYLTHWGLSVMLVSTGFAVAVSVRCYISGPISADFSLPWYVKTYWVLFNVAVPLAFLITVFYWTILYEAGVEEELNHGLDVAVHGLNSVVMSLLLVSAGHPSRILHVYQPVAFALTYVAFGVIYYFAGGFDTKGNPWVYEVINWAKPGPTIGVCAFTGVLLALLHLLAVGIALGRDQLALKLIHSQSTRESVPLQQTNNLNA